MRMRAQTWRRCWPGPLAAAPRRAARPQDPANPDTVLVTPHGVTRSLLPSQSNMCIRGPSVPLRQPLAVACQQAIQVAPGAPVRGPGSVSSSRMRVSESLECGPSCHPRRM